MIRLAALAAALALGATPALAQSDSEAPRSQVESETRVPAIAPRAPLPPKLAELRAQDARVLRLGYRLATGNARFCSDATHSVGLLLHDMRAYGDGDELRSILGLTGDVGVQALVPDGPAMRAGLKVDDTIVAIGAMRIADIPVEDSKSWERIETIRTETERLLAESGALPLTVLRADGPGEITIEGVPACRSRFEIGDDGRAVADGHRVVIGADFAGIDYSDPLLAAVLAHEFGHNLLRHRAWMDANGGRKRKAVRLTEREADRLMPWLLANAGFEPQAAAEFFEKWGPRHGGWIFRARSHDGWDERVDFVAAEIARMQALGSSDWSQHFLKEELPGDVAVAGR